MADSAPSPFLHQRPRGCWGSKLRSAAPGTRRRDLEARAAPGERGGDPPARELDDEMDELEFPRLRAGRATGRRAAARPGRPLAGAQKHAEHGKDTGTGCGTECGRECAEEHGGERRRGRGGKEHGKDTCAGSDAGSASTAESGGKHDDHGKDGTDSDTDCGRGPSTDCGEERGNDRGEPDGEADGSDAGADWGPPAPPSAGRAGRRSLSLPARLAEPAADAPAPQARPGPPSPERRGEPPLTPAPDECSQDPDALSSAGAFWQDAYAPSHDADACWQHAYAFPHDAVACWQDADAYGSPNQGTGLCVGVVLLPCAQAWAGGSTPTAGWSAEAEVRVTSLTLLNVPAHYTEAMLQWTLDSLGLLSSCNFVYLPRVKAAGDGMSLNMGHALLNFATPDDAELARGRLAGHAWDGGAGFGGEQMLAEVEDAVPQGYQACSDYFDLLTCEQTSSDSMLDWLEVPALNQGSPALRDY